MIHLMTDTETLGTRPGAIILSVAFVRFTDEASMSVNLSVPEQEALGMEMDPGTLQWWHDQEAKAPGAYAAATVNPLSLVPALEYINQWIAWAAPDDPRYWCHGATFDCPLLQELYRRVGVPCPWGGRDFWRVRDTRTLYDLACINEKDYAVPPPHIALNDAIGQTRAANAALAILARAHQIQPAPPPIDFAAAQPVTYTGTHCAECGTAQFNTYSGVTCLNGHGGADAA